MGKHKFDFWVSGYGTPGQPSILECRFDPFYEKIDIINTSNELYKPSWSMPHPACNCLYAVEQYATAGKLVTLAKVGGRLKRMASLSTMGADPCHISMSPSLKHLIVSNYTSGNLSVFELQSNGFPVRMTDYKQHSSLGIGHGNQIRQEKPHVHFTCFHHNHVYVCDLGLNCIFIYGWDEEKGFLSHQIGQVDFPDGAGPRHLVFSKNGAHLYVVCELNASVHVFTQKRKEEWRRIQVESIVPLSFSAFEQNKWAIGAAIHFADDHTLCVTSRGCNIVTIFKVNEDGTLFKERILSTGGNTPRDFLVMEDWMFVANQDSNSVNIFHRGTEGYDPISLTLNTIKPSCLSAVQ